MNKSIGKFAFEGEVLLCEDNRMNQELIIDRLAKVGISTVVAENGKEGVELVASRLQSGTNLFDLIFMDIHMPVMDGLEATAKIIKLTGDIPIVAMTANSTPDKREQYIECGMVDCINKPFTTQELMACLMKYITPQSNNLQDDTQKPQDEEKLRIKFINSFLRDNKTKHDEIDAAIKDGNIKLAHRLAHTLKSNAALLGKTRLQKAAEEVESLLSNEENRLTPAALNLLKDELNAVLDEFGHLSAEAPVAAPSGKTKHLDNQKTRELFEALDALLDGGSPDCLHLLGDLRQIPGTEELAQQIEYFEFDLAMKTLAQLQKEIMVTDHELDA
jgi:CheY-like chemotaxis protein